MPLAPRVLLAEDDDDHAELVMRAMEGLSARSEIVRVTDGEAVLDYLLRRGDFSDVEEEAQPHVVLLDLKLPKIDGLEVLRRIKSSEELRTVPVVVLTTSSDDSDVRSAYELGANSYLVKPIENAQFQSLVVGLGLYWLDLNHPPTPDR